MQHASHCATSWRGSGKVASRATDDATELRFE
jgi:hypothetical protein